ncbi:class I SAM-dependent methyltransferase [Patescibacteria group bacterium]|nr:class I SAM-dependent methyltransferase [Patescibacteria group bacterium]
MGEGLPIPETRPIRDTMLSKAGVIVSENPWSKKWLTERAEKEVKRLKIQEYLAPKIVYKDKLAGKVEKGLSVLSIGSGKGNELDEIDQILPGVKVRGLDPHDFHTPSVAKRLKKLAHDTEYLPKEVVAENLIGIEDKSMDGITLQYVLHHIDERLHSKIMEEVKRVLKNDGYLFVAEDAPKTEEEKRKTKTMDDRLNLTLPKPEKEVSGDTDKWTKLFQDNGFEVVDNHEEVDSDKVRRSFFVLKKKKEE